MYNEFNVFRFVVCVLFDCNFKIIIIVICIFLYCNIKL